MNPNAQEALARWREENPDAERTQRNPYQKWQDQDTRKTAIGAFCWTCCGGTETEAAGIRATIRDCTANGENGASRCPLYAWRPYKGKAGEEEDPPTSPLSQEVEDELRALGL